MVSLTTVYGISIVLASIAGMGSAFLGNKIYPLSGGAVVEGPSIDIPEHSAPPAAEQDESEFNKSKPTPPPNQASAPPRATQQAQVQEEDDNPTNAGGGKLKQAPPLPSTGQTLPLASP